ncbi:MAG: hypothetical protein H0V39_04115 [Nitrosomonas sp.]|nr:hypothetical protein [Nitrosomonas sp.]
MRIRFTPLDLQAMYHHYQTRYRKASQLAEKIPCLKANGLYIIKQAGLKALVSRDSTM